MVGLAGLLRFLSSPPINPTGVKGAVLRTFKIVPDDLIEPLRFSSCRTYIVLTQK